MKLFFFFLYFFKVLNKDMKFSGMQKSSTYLLKTLQVKHQNVLAIGMVLAEAPSVARSNW